MPTTYAALSSRDLTAGQTGFSRFIVEISALFDGAVEIFTEALDGSSAARARFPSAD
jgi:hypothetical protein